MIIFMGVAGAGKSAQGRMLADTLGLPWLSTGEFLRMLIAGERRKDMLQGKLLSDKEIIALVQKIFAIVDTDTEFVLDGFPRTLPQANWLLSQVQHGQLSVTAVVHLKISEEIVEKRLLERGRQDDTKEAIAQRFEEYRELTMPIIDMLGKNGIQVIEIDGDGDIAGIYAQLTEKLFGVAPHLKA